MAKVPMSSYILCKILSFQARVAQEVFTTSGSYSLAELIILWTFNIQNWFICSSIRNWIAYAKEANIVNKDSPIHIYWKIITWLWGILWLVDLTINYYKWYKIYCAQFWISNYFIANKLFVVQIHFQTSASKPLVSIIITILYSACVTNAIHFRD